MNQELLEDATLKLVRHRFDDIRAGEIIQAKDLHYKFAKSDAEAVLRMAMEACAVHLETLIADDHDACGTCKDFQEAADEIRALVKGEKGEK